jgi:dTDP-4-amino-4,6-dideoxygalactose transaminase
MPPDTIPVLHPLLPRADLLLPYLQMIDASRTYTNWGPLTSELERRLSGLFGLGENGVVSASSGTAALVGAILATAGRATSSRPFAILPSFTFVATAISVEQCGYQPYFADVDADTWMLEADRLVDHPILERTGLVVVVAALGRPVPQDPWRAFRRRTGIPVVIDGAASFEGVSDDPARFIGEIPVALSFHATKTFATGEGGCVATTDSQASRFVTEALNFGFFANRECRVASTNGKMSEYHAAIGLAELDHWPAKRLAFRAVADRYRQRLDSVGLADRCVAAPAVAGCYVLFQCRDVQEADRVQESLTLGKIEFRLWYGKGLHTQQHFHDLSRDRLDVTERVARVIIGVPVAVDLSDGAIERVVIALKREIDER